MLSLARRGKGKRQRFYARNAVKTTLDASMPGVRAFDAFVSGLTPALACRPGFIRRRRALPTKSAARAARLIAYVGRQRCLPSSDIALCGPVCPPQWPEPGCPLARRPSPSASTISNDENRDLRDSPASSLAAARMSSAGPTPEPHARGRARNYRWRRTQVPCAAPSHRRYRGLDDRRERAAVRYDGYIAARHWFDATFRSRPALCDAVWPN